MQLRTENLTVLLGAKKTHTNTYIHIYIGRQLNFPYFPHSESPLPTAGFNVDFDAAVAVAVTVDVNVDFATLVVSVPT